MNYSYLALGDSYTIGEEVTVLESFPYQVLQLLRNRGFSFFAPEIIAATGWTTDELSAAIDKVTFLKSYNFVSLLIGVNNQYRGRSIENFAEEFETLLKKSIHLAGGNANNVFVLSIPDWGKTPFAAGKDEKKIEEQINDYNQACKTISSGYNCTYIDITCTQRKDAADKEFLAADLLHPGAKEYSKWAKMLSDKISEQLHSA